MANVRNSNSFFIEDTGLSLDVIGIRVTHIVLTSTNTGALFVLSDNSTGAVKIKMAIAADKTMEFLDLSDNPIVFPNGIDPTTVTNCVATLMVQESRA